MTQHTTHTARARPSAAARWLAVTALAFAVAALVLLGIGAMHPTGHFTFTLLGVIPLGLAGVVWLALAIMMLVVRRWQWGLVAVPVTLALAMGLPATPAPEALGLALAKPALESAAAAGECPNHAGVFTIIGCRDVGGSGTAFVVGGAGFLNAVGFAHFTDASEGAAMAARLETEGIGAEQIMLTPLGDGWYRYTEDW